MRIAPQRNDLLHRIGVADRILLREETDAARPLRPLEGADIPPLQRYPPRIGHALRNRLDQRGFARAVRPDEHQPLPRPKLEGKAVHHRLRAVAHRDVFRPEHRPHPAFRAR